MGRRLAAVARRRRPCNKDVALLEGTSDRICEAEHRTALKSQLAHGVHRQSHRPASPLADFPEEVPVFHSLPARLVSGTTMELSMTFTLIRRGM